MRHLLGIIFFLILSLAPVHAFAEDQNSFITIVNPVRISTYTKNPVESLQSEYRELSDRNLPATWLVTFEVLNNSEMVSSLKAFNKKQELGIFLEVSPGFSKDSNVIYNKTNSWHRANSLFLSGYEQNDRRKLIDTVFAKFKKTFGYYPKSVGAWWVDAYSLSYMKQKYQITGVLGVSDQYDLDGYQVWGTPWSVPYYPSLKNASIPAGSVENKIDVVQYRWAPRDPLNGYLSPSKAEASLYSTQDYTLHSLTHDYFSDLVGAYAFKNDLNEFGQATLGLEADYSPEVYTNSYSDWLNIIKNFEDKGVVVTSMRDFSKWYQASFPDIPPAQTVIADDLLGTPRQVFWFQNGLYRAGVIYNKATNQTKVIDLRVYPQNLVEPFYESPNSQYNLSINLPYVIDSVIDKNSAWDFNAGKIVSVLKKENGIELMFEKGKIIFGDKSISLTGISLPAQVKSSPQISIGTKNNTVYIYPKENYPVDKDGIFYSDYSIHVPFTISSKLAKYKLPLIFLSVTLLIIVIFLVKKFKLDKQIRPAILVILLVLTLLFLIGGSKKYYISQTEADALSVLSRFPAGNVLVYDKDCLKCTFTTSKPAAAAGKKGYVEKIGRHDTNIDLSFLTATTSQESREILQKKNIRYVYLSKYENYIESLPYVPEDLGLKRIYENANVQIWQVL